MTSFLKRCWRRRWIRALTWTCITLMTLVLLLHTWVDWAGARAWRAAEQRVAAEGLTLDFRATLPEPIPDEENFCATPLLTDLSVVVDGDPLKGTPGATRKALTEALGLPGASDPKAPKRPSLRRQPGETADAHMRAWGESLHAGRTPVPETDPAGPAREVLAALSYQDAAVAELARRLDRPKAQLMPSLKTQPLPEMLFALQIPQFSSLQASGNGLSLRALAAAHAGDSVKAHEALRVLLRLAEAAGNEPFLIGLLVNRAMTAMAMEPLWEVCRLRLGTPEQFQALEADLRRLDSHAASMRAWKSELAAGVGAIQYLKRTRGSDFFSDLTVMPGSQLEMANWVAKLLPAGLFDLNAASTVHMELDHVLLPLRDGSWEGVQRAQPKLEATLKQAKAEWYWNLDKVMPILIMPAVESVNIRAIYHENMLRQAIVACALEQWYASHQSYPESLGALGSREGDKSTRDPVTGEAMHYEKAQDGRYRLWSVGFDRTDNGGKWTEKESARSNSKASKLDYKGDWVWEYPAESAKH